MYRVEEASSNWKFILAIIIIIAIWKHMNSNHFSMLVIVTLGLVQFNTDQGLTAWWCTVKSTNQLFNEIEQGKKSGKVNSAYAVSNALFDYHSWMLNYTLVWQLGYTCSNDIKLCMSCLECGWQRNRSVVTTILFISNLWSHRKQEVIS